MSDMTSTEAVFQLKNLKEHCSEMSWSKDVTALDIAIGRLEDKSKWVDKTSLSMKCFKCGARSIGDTPYCPYCGREIE